MRPRRRSILWMAVASMAGACFPRRSRATVVTDVRLPAHVLVWVNQAAGAVGWYRGRRSGSDEAVLVVNLAEAAGEPCGPLVSRIGETSCAYGIVIGRQLGRRVVAVAPCPLVLRPAT